ncbi:hypothetical protein [Ensifer canadensis]
MPRAAAGPTAVKAKRRASRGRRRPPDLAKSRAEILSASAAIDHAAVRHDPRSRDA